MSEETTSSDSDKQKKTLILVGVAVLIGLITGLLAFYSVNLNEKEESQKLPVDKQALFLGPLNKFSFESPDLLLVEGNSLLASPPPVMVTPQVLAQIVGEGEVSNEITTHVVESGESLWSIAKEYGLTIDTVVLANDLENAIIQPGQELLILPVDGLIHLVKKDETLNSIAKKYEADPGKIALINDIWEGDEIFENQALIIPGGKMPALPSEIRASSFTGLSTNNFYGLSHDYPYGQCTWWVAQKRVIPSWGNAKDWLNNAIASGRSVCVGRYCSPRVGAVISLKGSRTYGHVGYVESVKGNKVVFSEMNYIGWGKMNFRSLRIGSHSIIGYIY